ncbi:hypothetical protein HHL11_19980 [Ramlibacter sp. G-1-2-2]|uniref:Uncharacterized protein n=1 Tax=Ramlibacter agri TaxID=2728837 RepID=A0A848HEM4_9BURK|nr:hypothetical protein [Ramlibacter agri]NML46038.1 hypothetical protein [Ramlibacter agri]
MLDKSATYHKSAKGAEAIATRQQSGLTPRQRSMLILVDGRRSYAELARLARVLGDPEQLLAQLAAEGYIEAGSPRAGPPTAPAPLFDSDALDATWGYLSGPAPLESGPVPLDSMPPLDSAPGALVTPAARAVSLDQAKSAAVARLKDLLGPEADDLCVRLEAAASPQEFRAAVRRTEAVLRAVVGPELAAQFLSEVVAAISA